MRLILVRHGETQENAAGIIQGHLPGTLSEKGLEQVHALGIRLAREPVDAIYSSDLQRARETAEAIREHHRDAPLRFTEDLRERYLGGYQGLRGSDIDWDALHADAGIEHLELMIDRARRFLARLQDDHPQGTVVAVGHGGINYALLSVTLGESLARTKEIVHLDNAGVTILEGDTRLHPVLLNGTDHLKVGG